MIHIIHNSLEESQKSTSQHLHMYNTYYSQLPNVSPISAPTNSVRPTKEPH